MRSPKIGRWKRQRGRGVRAAGVGLILAGIGSGVVVIALGIAQLEWFVPVGLTAGFLCLRRSDRLLAEGGDAVLAENPEGFALLLRSFDVDDRRLVGESGLSPNFEQLLVTALRRLAPVVAVGRPEEELPPSGAARLYLGSEEWQAKVRALMDAAGLVVFLMFRHRAEAEPGEARGLQWELEQVFASGREHPVLIVLPSAEKLVSTGLWWPGLRKKRRSAEESFTMLAGQLETISRIQLPGSHAEYQFLYFEPGAQPLPLRAGRFKPGLAGFLSALAPVFSSFGSKPPISNPLIVELRNNRFLQIMVATMSCLLAAYYL